MDGLPAKVQAYQAGLLHVPTPPRIGGSASSYVPFPTGSIPTLFRQQVAPGLGLAGAASAGGPWMGLAKALNEHLSGVISSGGGAGHLGVGAGSMFGSQFGRTPATGGVPSRRTIYGPGPKAF